MPYLGLLRPHQSVALKALITFISTLVNKQVFLLTITCLP